MPQHNVIFKSRKMSMKYKNSSFLSGIKDISSFCITLYFSLSLFPFLPIYSNKRLLAPKDYSVKSLNESQCYKKRVLTVSLAVWAVFSRFFKPPFAVQPLERIEDLAPGDLLVFDRNAQNRFDGCILCLWRSEGVLSVVRVVKQEKPPHRLQFSKMSSLKPGASVLRFRPDDCLLPVETIHLAEKFAEDQAWLLKGDYSEACRLFASWCRTGRMTKTVHSSFPLLPGIFLLILLLISPQFHLPSSMLTSVLRGLSLI